MKVKKNKIVCPYLLSLLFCCIVIHSCGCGPTFLYNWRPKPWNHPFTNTETGLSNLIDINGYYETHDSIKPYSIMFFENGLCISLTTKVSMNNDEDNSAYLDTMYSNKPVQIRTYKDEFGYTHKTYDYKKYRTSWGTYEIKNDTIKAFLIEDLIGCDGTRKDIISMTYLIEMNKQLKQILITSSNEDYGYSRELNVSNCTFHPIENKRDSIECPYLRKRWFYKSDKK